MDNKSSNSARRADEAQSIRYEEALEEMHDDFLGKAQVGVAFLDRDLRFLTVNEPIAALMGRRVEDIAGQTIREAAPELAEMTEQHYRPILDTGKADLNVHLRGPLPGYPDDPRSLLVNRVPVTTRDGDVIGIVITVQDLTNLRRERRSMEVELGFERLLSDVAATLGKLEGEEIDGSLHEALAAVGEFFGADRTQISEITRDSEVHVTHSWARSRIDPVPLGTMWAAMIPGALRTVLSGEVFSFSHIDELVGRGFDVDRETFLEVGTMAHMSIPIEVGGRILGVLTFGVLDEPRDWPETQRDRLLLLAQVFGSALIRRDAERRLKSMLAEVQNLKQRLFAETRYLEKEIAETGWFEEIIGESEPMRAIFHQVEQVAPTDATILILGETGTGKELVARSMHRMSSRSQHTLVKVNCATLPSNLIESELFGHERGAFTGAVNRKIGRFEVAHEGTIFLDEIGDLPLDLQAKLLRVLQDGEFERLGSTETKVVNVRVIAATNRDLPKAIQDGDFRSDLFYRLRVVPIELPPLRERRDDIPLLAWHFVRRHQAGMNKNIRRIPATITRAMRNYGWPGNVRELANVIERAVILTVGDTLAVNEAFVHDAGFSAQEDGAEDLQSVERAHIIGTLERCGWRVKGTGNAAERLGLNPSTLRARLKKLEIKRP